jgi:hypothetical protein
MPGKTNTEPVMIGKTRPVAIDSVCKIEWIRSLLVLRVCFCVVEQKGGGSRAKRNFNAVLFKNAAEGKNDIGNVERDVRQQKHRIQDKSAVQRGDADPMGLGCAGVRVTEILRSDGDHDKMKERG